MEYLKVFTDFAKVMEPLGDAERGRLFTAMLEYAERGTEPDFRGNERFIWPMAKLQVDRTVSEYEKKVELNRENGKKGGRPRKETEENPKNPSVFSETQKNQTVFLKTQKSQDKEKDKEKDKDNIYIPPTPLTGGKERENPGKCSESVDVESASAPKGTPRPAPVSELSASFERFWSVWPKKISKGQAEKTWKKLKPDAELTEKIIAGVNRAIKNDRRFREMEYTPHASTWLNDRGWEDSVYTSTGIGIGQNRTGIDAQPSYDLEEFKRMSAFSVPKID